MINDQSTTKLLWWISLGILLGIIFPRGGNSG